MKLDLSAIDPRDWWLIYVILTIVCFAFITLFFILTHRVGYYLNERKKSRFSSILISLLSGALNNPEKKMNYIDKIERISRKRWQKEILLDKLVEMCYSFQGVYEARSREIYDHFELEKISRRKLKSRKWHRIIEGIIELSIVGDDDEYKTIIPFLDHPNFFVRSQSKIAIVEIGRIKGLMEMESKIGTMSKWTFISILSILHRNPIKLSNAQLDKLKKSENPATRKLSAHLDKYSVAY